MRKTNWYVTRAKAQIASFQMNSKSNRNLRLNSITTKSEHTLGPAGADQVTLVYGEMIMNIVNSSFGFVQ